MTATEPDTRAEPTWSGVVAIFANSSDATPMVELFRGRGTAERRALVPHLKAESRRLGEGQRQDYERRVSMLRTAGTACLGGPAAIAQWLGRRDLGRASSQDGATILALLRDRDPEWVPDVARRLAPRIPIEQWQRGWELVDLLVRDSGIPAPTDPGYVHGWMVDKGRAVGGSGRTTLAQRLAADPFLTRLLPALFEVTGIGSRLDRWWCDALVELADAGSIERGLLLDGCLSRLLRGERTGALKGFTALHEALRPTDDELAVAARTDAYARLLAVAPSPVAGLAQDVLRRLDASGHLDPERIEHVSRAALFRTEKKLVRAQLVWLGQAIKRHPAHAGAVLASVGHAFGADGYDLQERALAVVDKHLGKLPADQVERACGELAEQVPLLAPGLRERAAALLGGTIESVESVESVEEDRPALVPPPPRELPGPIADLPELVEELAVFFANTVNPWGDSRGHSTDPIAVERIVAALLREHAHDRVALADSLAPMAVEQESMLDHDWYVHQVIGAVTAMVVVASGRSRRRPGWFRTLLDMAPTEHDPIPGTADVVARMDAPQRFLLSRLYEVALRLREPETTPYLAEPADATGHVDPEALLDALDLCAAHARTPWRRDFDQALLRLPADIAPDTIARAGRLTSPEGRRLARLLAADGRPAALVTGRRHRNLHREYSDRLGRSVHYDGMLACVVPGGGETPDCARDLFTLADPGRHAARPHWVESVEPDLACWPLILPEHRDVLAAHLVVRLQCGLERNSRAAELLPALAEAEGSLGTGTSLALAYALGSVTPEDRTAAVDALVTLAARPHPWDPAALGRDIGEAVCERGLKNTRVTGALRDAARAGADDVVWRTLTGFLPVLLSGAAPATGLADTLALAAETAAGCAAGPTPIVGLTELAAGKGSSRAVKEARRLNDIVGG